jgi:hypothetical protein
LARDKYLILSSIFVLQSLMVINLGTLIGWCCINNARSYGLFQIKTPNHTLYMEGDHLKVHIYIYSHDRISGQVRLSNGRFGYNRISYICSIIGRLDIEIIVERKVSGYLRFLDIGVFRLSGIRLSGVWLSDSDCIYIYILQLSLI